MPVGWNWKNSMSWSGTPRRYASATPSPVSEWALEVVRNMRPKPPVANITALDRKMCSSPSAMRYATTPRVWPPSTSTSTTWYSSKNRTPCLTHCWYSVWRIWWPVRSAAKHERRTGPSPKFRV